MDGIAIIDKPQNILSQDICSTAGSQLEKDVDDLRQRLTIVEKERDRWRKEYFRKLEY